MFEKKSNDLFIHSFVFRRPSLISQHQSTTDRAAKSINQPTNKSRPSSQHRCSVLHSSPFVFVIIDKIRSDQTRHMQFHQNSTVRTAMKAIYSFILDARDDEDRIRSSPTNSFNMHEPLLSFIRHVIIVFLMMIRLVKVCTVRTVGKRVIK